MNYGTFCALLAASSLASASPTTFSIDPSHTHPMFEADHLNGLSVWRGLFKKTRGTIILDPAAHTGALDVAVDIASVDFGNDKLNEVAVNSTAPPIFEAQKYPIAYYKGTLGNFINGAPTTVAGFLTLHGVTKPVALKINTFKCMADQPPPKQQNLRRGCILRVQSRGLRHHRGSKVWVQNGSDIAHPGGSHQSRVTGC